MQLLSEEEAKQAEVRKKLKNDQFLRELQSQLKPGIEHSERRFRVHEFTHSVMALPNFTEYDHLKRYGLIDGLLDELDTRDFLGCTTALEMLADIAAARKQNIAFFNQIGLLDKVYALFQQTKADPDMGILHIACIRFFGYLCTADANSLTNFPLFALDIFDSVYRFDAFDATRRQLAFETLAVISSTSGAKQFLSGKNCPYNMQKAMNHLGVAVATAGPAELKARHLEAVRIIFDSFDEQQKAAESAILRQWFQFLGDPFPALLLQCLRTPIPELQIATLHTLLALMRHQWAFAPFCSLNGFVDFLVSRDACFGADGMRLRFELICRMVDSSSADINVGQMELLKDYREKGPFWPAPKVEIGTESQ